MRYSDEVDAAAREVYDVIVAQLDGGKFKDFPALRRRIHELHQEYSDLDMVTAVACHIAEVDGTRFKPWTSLTVTAFAYFRFLLDIPDGAARFRRWLYRGVDKQTGVSAEYWLGRWGDAAAVGDFGEQQRAEQQLTALWEEHAATI